MMYKGCKIRLYPTKEQEELLWKHIHACRFIWNYMLEKQEGEYQNNKKYLSSFDMINHLTILKKEEDYNWLSVVCRGSLGIICRDLDKAYMAFFKGKRNRPNFKSKKHYNKSFPIRKDVFHFNDDYTVTVSKIGRVKVKDIILNDNLTNPRITYINKKWILTFGVECENQAKELTNKSMGIDLGIKELAVVSCGDEKIVIHNINKSKRMRILQHKLKHIQRVINRKYRANGNYKKTKGILKYESLARELQYKIMNIRHNHIHQSTHKLILYSPKTVIMENLNISKMMNNRFLSKSIREQGFYEFIRQMKYKCEWNGIEFVQAEEYYPSSKTCSCCGNIKKDLKLSDRTYNCLKCGLSIDRDYNAAINLMKYASHDKRLTA